MYNYINDRKIIFNKKIDFVVKVNIINNGKLRKGF